jgi:nicotinamide mononucleotide transporter
MPEILSVNNIFFTFLGYPMSYIEAVGTVLYLWSVWLIAKRKMLTWPIGILSVVLYALLFYQIRLYSDAIEQIYYIGASIYGWWHWSKAPRDHGTVSGVGFSGSRSILFYVVLTLFLSAVVGTIMSRIHILAPVIFPEEASFPYLDAFTTIMSFTAMWLMARQRTESWIYWIIVDIIGIGLYYSKDVKFVALLYVILLVLASKGLVEWLGGNQKEKPAAMDE